MRDRNRATQKGLQGVDAQEYTFNGGAGRRRSRFAKRGASPAVRCAREAEAAWVSDGESVS